jgi:NADPH:quinone reductase-like Zn-dependent oxidoreductase
MGYRVIAVCSPHNYDLVKSLGAIEATDYSDPAKCSEEIKRLTGGGVTIGLNTISEGNSWEICLNGYKSGAAGMRLNGLLLRNEEVQASAKSKDVELSDTMMYSFFGRACRAQNPFWAKLTLHADSRSLSLVLLRIRTTGNFTLRSSSELPSS